jgi:hypothetical protein
VGDSFACAPTVLCGELDRRAAAPHRELRRERDLVL